MKMKLKLLLAAGLLSLSAGPAFAYSPDMAPDMAKAVKDIWADQLAVDQAGKLAGASSFGETKAPKAEAAAATWYDEALTAKPDGKDLLAGELGGPAVPPPATTTADGQADMSAYQGMGGPLEEVDYPACSRTVRDSCIQRNDRG